MTLKNVNIRTVLTMGVISLVMVGRVAASPSGLNNIPTADTAPAKTLVFQTWGVFARESSPTWTAGFMYGLINGVEVGADQKVGSGGEGPLTLQAKVLMPGLSDETPVRPLVGVANISDDTDDAGEMDPYVVLTFDTRFSRFHVGYSFQEHNWAAFGGIDRTFTVMDRDLVLRGDVRQVVDGDEVLGSVGLLYVLPFNLVFEGWGSFASTDGAEESMTVKLNYVLSF